MQMKRYEKQSPQNDYTFLYLFPGNRIIQL